ncbi:hypothetical protein Ddye_029501 [Dipteronia dyeriana]|uniref:RING-type domain-containing protein n=1 Tax=Dipteronia dyeriana TaxID=168575 RepID=A0AAD9TEJ3_9ROSI|nr:hypothetical protein Ddye_029496 [Dipteronia dyeriana]KAK2634709.1 hypothetical protein Ddye_029501 [Dipteronia dyeriana]
MAVQDQHGQQVQQYQQSNLMTQNPLMAVIGGTESDLTSCNAYGFRKRARDNNDFILIANLNHLQQHQNQSTKLLDVDNPSGSCPASTSSRHRDDQDLNSYLDGQNLELKAFIRLQNEKLRAMVGLIMEERIMRKVEAKERELEIAKRVKRDLEEKVKEKSEENQMWFNVAKQSEASVFSLRQSLVKLLLYNNINSHDHVIEGFGETNGEDDEARQVMMKSCKGCGGGDVSVLVLPCRHLCLCKHCDFRFNCCPVCNSVKHAALNVLYS